MKQLYKRLASTAGETLVETMAAILIFTFGSIIMLTMISSAADINQMAEKADNQYFEDMQAVEMANLSEAVEGTVKLSSNGRKRSVNVNFYGGKDGSLYAYYVEGGSGS